MAIPNGVIFIWSGTNASIPSGWERVTDLDGKFPKGHANSSTNPNLTGGTATHTHNATANHSHTMNDHTHSVTIDAHTINAFASGGGRIMAPPSHNHGGSVTTGSSSGGDLSSVSATYSAISNNPPYYEVIFIRPSTVAGGLPNNAIGLSDDTGFTNNTGKYSGYYQCDGNNSTPNFVDKFLRGAGTGADAGTTGGSTNNAHILTHTHTVSSHTHAAVTSGYSGESSHGGSTSTSSDKLNAHYHTVSFGSSTISVNTNPTLTTTETVQPLHKLLNAIQNRSGTVYTPVGIIGMWLGTLSSIPGNFELVSSMYDYYLKTNTTGIGSTGGANTHSHSNNTHTHTESGSHTHSISGLDHLSVGYGGSTGSYEASARPSQGHTSSMASVSTSSFSTATTSSDTSSNEPEYRTVAFIKYKGEKGGAFLFNFIR